MNRISNTEVLERFKEIEILKETLGYSANDRIKQIQNQIVQEVSFLVYSLTNKYKRFSNYEDLVQEGFIGLIKAARTFDYTLYPNFFVFAHQRIINGIRRSAKKYDVVYNPGKVKTVYCDSESMYQEVTDEDLNLDEVLIRKESTERVNKVVNTLPTRERKIMQSLFGINTNSHTLRQTERYCGLTYERIRQIKNRIIEKLKYNPSLIDLEK